MRSSWTRTLTERRAGAVSDVDRCRVDGGGKRHGMLGNAPDRTVCPLRGMEHPAHASACVAPVWPELERRSLDAS